MTQDIKDLHWEAVHLVDTLYRQHVQTTRPRLIERALARARRRFDKAWPGVMAMNRGKQWGKEGTRGNA